MGHQVITSSVHTDNGMARFHIDALGEKGLYYTDQPSLVRILTTFDRSAVRDANAYRAFEPEKVMEVFARHFLDDDDARSLPPPMRVDAAPRYGSGSGGNWN